MQFWLWNTKQHLVKTAKLQNDGDKEAVNNIINEATHFLSGLESTFRQGLPQTKLVALRQCIERIWINKPAGIVKLLA